MTEPKRTRLIWFVIAALLLTAAVLADDDCRGRSCNDTGDVNVGLDSSVVVGAPVIGGATSFITGMGDVDINDYYRSYQFLIWQGTQPNLLALGVYYDSIGLHAAAAAARCSVGGVRKVFDDQVDCIAKNTAARMLVPPPPQINKKEEEEKQRAEREWRDEQEQRYENLAGRYASMEMQQQQAPPPQIIERTVVQQQPFLNADKRTRLQAILDEDK